MKLPINMKYTKLALAIALLPALSAQVSAGEILTFDGYTGDGYILIDEDENVVAPGIKAVTKDINNDDFKSKNGFAPNMVQNCLMANNEALCDSEKGSGKRVKNNITGRNAFDTVYNVKSSGGTTEYFNFGKLTNKTNARMTGFDIQLGTGTGANFVGADASGIELSMDQVSALSAKAAEWAGSGGVDGQDPLQRVNLPSGLFGKGGQDRGEEGIGYFSLEQAGFIFTDEGAADGKGSDTLTASAIFGDDYQALFGNGLLSRNQVPVSLVYDDGSGEDAALVYWKAGNLWINEEGNIVAQSEVDALLKQEGYLLDTIEDLSNVNLNYTFDIGDDLNGNQITVRFVPKFSNIVTAAQTDYQFAVAAALDTAEVPFLFYDQTAEVGTKAGLSAESKVMQEEFKEVLAALNGLPTAGATQQGIERAGTSYLRNYGTQAQLLGRDQIELVLQHLSNSRSLDNLRNSHSIAASEMDGSATTAEDAASMLASSGSNTVQVNDKLTTFMSASVSTGDIKSSQNGIGSDYNGYTFVIGADYLINDNLRAGAALSYGKNKADIDDHRGELDAKGYSVMAYGTYGERTGLYADVAAGHTWLDFDNKRNIDLGDWNRTAKSSTDGTQWSLAAKTGYNFDLEPLIIGPSVQYHWHDLKVDGYSEKNAGVLSMNVDDMKFKSQTLWLGGQASLPLTLNKGMIEPFASVHWVKEFKDSGANVATSFNNTLAFTTPLDSYDDKYMRASVGVMGSFATGSGLPVELSASYEGTFKNADYNQNRFQLGAAVRF